MHGQVLVMGAELDPNPPATHFFVEGSRWRVGVDAAGWASTWLDAMALADERRSARAHVRSAADEKAQKSKPNVSKTNPRKLSRLAANRAANP